MDAVIVFRDVVKEHGGLRPLRVRELGVGEGEVVGLRGPDAVQAAVLVDLLTGTTLPESGEVIIGGRNTRELSDQEDWLSFLDQFGIVNERVVLLDELSIAQNLAVPMTLSLDPMEPATRARVEGLAAEVGLSDTVLDESIARASPLTRALVRLGRAVALDPAILLMEHPTAMLDRADASRFAASVRTVAARRRLSVLAVASDPAFMEGAATRALDWRAATGEVSSAHPGWRWSPR